MCTMENNLLQYRIWRFVVYCTQRITFEIYMNLNQKKKIIVCGIEYGVYFPRATGYFFKMNIFTCAKDVSFSLLNINSIFIVKTTNIIFIIYISKLIFISSVCLRLHFVSEICIFVAAVNTWILTLFWNFHMKFIGVRIWYFELVWLIERRGLI